jgi:hypothetical protein
MVIGERFVWAHFGKTGGDSVHEMFGVISRHVIYRDAVYMPEKHLNFHANEKRLGYDLTHFRKRIMTLRRLPSWMLSFAHHKYRSHAIPIVKEVLVRGRVLFERVGDDVAGKSGDIGFREIRVDQILEEFMCGRIDHWFRTEFLAEDFITVMGEFVPISDVEKGAIRRIRLNVSPEYNKDISANFSAAELKMIYANCPLWARIEKEIYGDLLTGLGV